MKLGLWQTATILLLTATLAAGAIAAITNARYNEARRNLFNERAAHDTTRIVLATADSSRLLWERRAFQHEELSDYLVGLAARRAEELDASARLAAELTLAYETVRAQLVGSEVTEDSAGVRYAHLEADTLGDHIQVDVTVPAPPDSATGVITVERDPQKVWISLLETPEGEKLLVAETDSRVKVEVDRVITKYENKKINIPVLSWLPGGKEVWAAVAIAVGVLLVVK
jgi:hypothetical protein